MHTAQDLNNFVMAAMLAPMTISVILYACHRTIKTIKMVRAVSR